MRPAIWPRDEAGSERLLVIDPDAQEFFDRRIADLPSLVRSGDLVVVNDAATLPASLRAINPEIEVRLAGERADGSFRAVLFGAGDWRIPTERRPPPPHLAPGAHLLFAPDLSATITAVSELSPRLVDLQFDRSGAELWGALYRVGRPIQYSYLAGPLELWSVQTAYGAAPLAVELPSAGRPLRWSVLGELARRGVRLAALTHAAGLSSTGDPALDAALPLPERYRIPERTAREVRATRSAGGRVIAVGTSVVRALEGAAARSGGQLTAGEGETDLRIGPDHRLLCVDGLLTGLHEPAASHFSLLRAFVAPELLARAYAHAEAARYLGHEFGDSNLILPSLRARE